MAFCRRFGQNTSEPDGTTPIDMGNSMSAAFTVRLNETTLGALDQLAEKTERSRNWLVTKAIEDYIALNAWQVARIEAGIAAADRGEFASDSELARVRKKFTGKE
jgi:predicted transcriptional regulator